MFIGHFGAGFAVKPVGSKISLGTLFMAAQWIDLMWPIMLLTGAETVRIDPGNTAFTPFDFEHYPFTHSLVGVLVWAALFGGIHYLFKKDFKHAFLLGALVTSHWVLDLIVHRPDLPLAPGVDIKMGLGLWNHIIATVAVESLIFLGGVAIYASVTRAKNRSGKFGFISLVLFLSAIYVMNILGPPPEEAGPVAVVGLSQWLIVLWAYWVDRNREHRH